MPPSSRADELLEAHKNEIYASTSSYFAILMSLQWAAAVGAALWISPRTWRGTVSSPHPHIWLAALLGGAVTILPVVLCLRRPCATSTRHWVAVCQMSMSGLLIHLTGGRIETHFHIFGSLAFLAYYRDWRVLLSATAAAGMDHLLRGTYFTQSVFGVVAASPWRWTEHLAWMTFEDAILIRFCMLSVREMRGVAERAAQLEAVDAKNTFLAKMSHEIRTPINGILGMAELLRASELTAKQRKRLDTLRASSESLLAVLDDILDYSKLQADKLALEVADFDLRKVVEDVADLMALKAQEKEVEMLCFVEPAVPTRLRGDPNRVRQVLINLVGNAVKFTAAGSISLVVRLDDPPDPGVVRFDVIDTGIGIAPHKRHLLFQPFSQVEASTARKYGGTGLGLSIVAGLVKRLGGNFGVQSEEGKGSTFWFTAALPPQPEVERPRALALPGKRVLIVDDSAASRELLRRLLNYWKCIPDEAADAQGAMEKLRLGTYAYDAILVDREMPSCTGDEFLKLVRSRDSLREIPLIRMDNLRRTEEDSHWQKLGFAACVTKPIKQGDLGERLASILSDGAGKGPALVARRIAPAPLTAGKLLLVEDNPVNQEVALGILENLGYVADLADDGRSALELFGQNRYLAVLTDCSMPEMDGYELTRRIRARETGGAARIPIIAMTAHALSGDREKCLAAGMDDYVSKPVNPRILQAKLELFLRVDGASPDAAGQKPEAEPGPAAFQREELIDRVMGDEDLARRVAGCFVRDMKMQLAALASAIDGADHQKTHALAHSIKDAAASISGSRVAKAASAIEAASGEGDLSNAREDFSQLSLEFEKVGTEIARFLRP